MVKTTSNLSWSPCALKFFILQFYTSSGSFTPGVGPLWSRIKKKEEKKDIAAFNSKFKRNKQFIFQHNFTTNLVKIKFNTLNQTHLLFFRLKQKQANTYWNTINFCTLFYHSNLITGWFWWTNGTLQPSKRCVHISWNYFQRIWMWEKGLSRSLRPNQKPSHSKLDKKLHFKVWFSKKGY